MKSVDEITYDIIAGPLFVAATFILIAVCLRIDYQSQSKTQHTNRAVSVNPADLIEIDLP